VKEGDDLMAATRYALMMLRYARTETQRRNFHREIEYYWFWHADLFYIAVCSRCLHVNRWRARQYW
jgi:hypothetical protein